MWLIKGVGLGLLVFAGFFLTYFVIVIAGGLQGLQPHKATALSALTGVTIYRPLFWIALLLTISTACVYAKLLAR